MAGFAEHAVEEFAHVDGRVFRTFRALLTRPGLLTESYVRGQRKPVLGPLQVFLIANLVFFGFQSLFHASVFSNPLARRSAASTTSGWRRGCRRRVARSHHAGKPPAFDHAVVVNAKSLIILMTPPFALLAACSSTQPPSFAPRGFFFVLFGGRGLGCGGRRRVYCFGGGSRRAVSDVLAKARPGYGIRRSASSATGSSSS